MLSQTRSLSCCYQFFHVRTVEPWVLRWPFSSSSDIVSFSFYSIPTTSSTPPHSIPHPAPHLQLCVSIYHESLQHSDLSHILSHISSRTAHVCDICGGALLLVRSFRVIGENTRKVVPQGARQLPVRKAPVKSLHTSRQFSSAPVTLFTSRQFSSLPVNLFKVRSNG